MPRAGKAWGRAHKRIVWSGRVQAWQRSGRTQTDFCRRHEWPVATFAWWKRRLGATARDDSPARDEPVSGKDSRPHGEGFLPVRIVPPLPPEGLAWACELGFSDGSCVRLRTVPAPEFVRAVLAGL